MRRQLKPVKRGVERSEDEEKVRRRRREQMGGRRGEERRRNEGRHGFGADGARECQTGRGAAKECTSFNQGCRCKAGSVEWMKCCQLVEVVKQEREEDERKKKSRRAEEQKRRSDEEERRTGGHVLMALVPMRQAIYNSAKSAGKARGNADVLR